MQSEALRNIRTMRQVKTSLDLVGYQKLRTTNSLSRTAEEVANLKTIFDRQIEQILAKERKRSAATEAAIDKSRWRLIKAREKLAATINKNHALTELRHELQRARWEGRDSIPSKKAPLTESENLRRMELKY